MNDAEIAVLRRDEQRVKNTQEEILKASSS